jgi:hypothetical protein
MSNQIQKTITPVEIDRNIENVRILEKVMAEEKGINNLKGCVLAAIDYFVQIHCTAKASESQGKNT